MNQLIDKKENLRFISCSECNERGYFVDQNKNVVECPKCKGDGVYAYADGVLLSWKKKINSLLILEEKTERTIRAILNGIFLFFGLFGLLLGFWNLYQILNQGGHLLDFLNLRNGEMMIFWFSVISDLYIFYRLDREKNLRPQITRKKEEIKILEPDISFEELSGKGKIIKDVSHFFNIESNKVLEDAWNLAKKFNHQSVKPIHLLASLIATSTFKVILVRLGVNPTNLVEKVSRSLGQEREFSRNDPVLSPLVKKIFFSAYQKAYLGKRESIGIPDLIISILTVDSEAKEILYDLEVDFDKLFNVVEWINIQDKLRKQWRRFRSKAARKPKGAMDRAMTAVATPVLDAFSRDLTQLARVGALPVCVGRDREIEEIFRVFEGEKANPLVVGNPGVGKTMVIEGVASRMAAEDVPIVLKDKRLVSLSIASLVSGAGKIGELEERLNVVLDEVARAGNIVLYIDNIHNLIGVSSGGGETLDLSEILTTFLKQGRFYVIGSTDPANYSRYIERGGSLLDVFQKVEILEPETNNAILILEAKSGNIEYRHKVFFSYDAIEKAVTLSQRYIHDRYLPEKAINLLEEVAVFVKKTKGRDAMVTGEEVAEVVSRKARVKVTKVTEKESEKLLNLEEKIHERIIDQEEAVKAVASALRRARTELRDINRPIANLLFLGPTGVGKTELAKTVALVYFGSEKNMIRLDMSEYQTPAAINRLIGSPPGYGQELGYLTEAVRTNPFSLILLDELEKAHPDILNVFLQVMDDGRLTDGTGRTIDFTNAILIATSNAGTQLIQDRMREGKATSEIENELMTSALAQYFRPEFLNRFDKIVVFKPLSPENIEEIVKLLIQQVANRLLIKGITLQASPEAILELAKEGFDPIYGARPLRRLIQEKVDDALAKFLLTGKLTRRDVAVLEANGVIRVEKAREL